ncbi:MULTISPECIES: TIGR01620 family protein [unclassified Avibacterium]|uniref:TIGR01620 family protein n=1 Tax=unclassified Avibacterium TaxID=2685287 RepID=UPI0020269CFE|nr:MULTISPECIES: TIGR01620 family protein [unclassified Avibacterium]MCW9698398.1 YcjF family protein [Avibacterium sp. 20-129]MCW9732172.1 YcjF family protein [Avibacterium sp. 20-15]URL02715.1 YcjF family protein [Avibacterium sp. 20-126]URL04345.1 YcjF family protein [Avibacterium sp. 20-132]
MEKQIFHTALEDREQQAFAPKQTFSQENLIIETDVEDESGDLAPQFEQALQPKPRWWKKWLASSAIFFTGALIAQSIQWLIDTWQHHQWIYFSFALASCFFVVLGIGAMVNEWRKLVHLKKRMALQEKSQFLLNKSAGDFQQDFSVQESEKVQQLCQDIIKAMDISPQSPEVIQWQKQSNEGHSASERADLFSQTVLKPIDKQAQKLISKNAIEAAVVVAVSPLAVVDMFFVAWRNIRLINQLAKLYHIELGYFSRLRLLRMVLLNMAFAGATEVVKEIGMDWLSQDVTAKFSARIAQGVGVGLLTARLGIKAMEFCRPLAFKQEERPRLKHIQKDVLAHLKALLLPSKKA